jgi:hypothetical protein
MSSASGIGATPELVECFAQAANENDLRVIKVSIVRGTYRYTLQLVFELTCIFCVIAYYPFSPLFVPWRGITEKLVEAGKWQKRGDFMSDYANIRSYVEDNVPAYLLVRLDSPSGAEWLTISYVPDTAKVRDKVSGGVVIMTIIPRF